MIPEEPKCGLLDQISGEAQKKDRDPLGAETLILQATDAILMSRSTS